MVTKTRTKSTPDETLVRKEAKRILRRLSETGAFLAVSPGMENAVVLKAAGQARPLRIGVLETRIAEAFALNEWISCTSKGRVLQYKITSVGRAALKRMLAEDDRARVARKDDAFTAQHSTLSDVVMKDAAGHDQKHRINLTESPLGALARRVGKAGDPFLSMEEVAAGEMLRDDFERAQMGPRVAQNWERFLTVATPGSAAQGGNTLSGPVAAREAVGNALSALGPGLSDIALRCCCFLEGMETAEKRLGWSARSGKVVLKSRSAVWPPITATVCRARPATKGNVAAHNFARYIGASQHFRLDGPMMHMMTFDAAALLPQKDETLLEYWLSFAPVAPLMGVAYRPAKLWSLQSDAPAVSAPMPAATTRVKDPVEEAEVVAKETAEAVAETVAAPAPAPDAAPEAAPAPTAADSDLTRIKGIGAKLQAELNTLGLFTVAQLAEYTDAQIAALSEGMTSFKDRPLRDAWVAQAKELIG